MADFQNQYPSLPGHTVQFRDGNLNIKSDPTPPGTESILFLGTATDGPINQPVPVTPQNVNTVFGKMTNANGVANGATLIPAFEEAWNAGCRDIRLMRVSGRTAKLSLKGTSYTDSREDIASDELGVSQGNAAVTFVLPHGGVDASSLQVNANGLQLPSTAFVLTAGTASDLSAGVNPEVKASLALNADVADMEANITVSYMYDYKDADGVDQVGEVIESSMDNAGAAMIANGADKVFTLSFVPKAGLKLYADGAEVTASEYTINAVAKTITLHSTDKVTRDQSLDASYAHDVTTIVNPTVEIETVYGGSLYNQAKGKVEVANGIVTVTLTKPDAKKSLMSEAPIALKSTDYPSFQLFVNAVNGHPLNTNVFRATTKFNNELTNTLEAKTETFFAGGHDEIDLSKEELYKRLGGEKDSEGYVVKQGAYQILENYTVDYVSPLGVFADDKLVGKYDNFAYQLALACAVMSHFNSVTLGLISTSTPEDTTLQAVNDHVEKLIAIDNSFYMRDRFGNEIKDGEGERIDLGQFITIVAGPDLIVNNTRLGLVATNSPASVLGLISGLAPQSAPTNKALGSVLGLRYEYSAAQQNKLVEARYLVYKYKNNKTQVAIVDAMTAAHAGSDYTRVSTARIVKRVVNIIRRVADPYIGEPNDVANRNALTSAIAKELDKEKESKALLSYDFQIVATPQMELMGEASIELSLQAPRELRRLTTVVSLTV